MENLQQATEKICDLKGSILALQAVMNSLFQAMPQSVLEEVAKELARQAEACRVVLLNEKTSEFLLSAFERDVQMVSARLQKLML